MFAGLSIRAFLYTPIMGLSSIKFRLKTEFAATGHAHSGRFSSYLKRYAKAA